MSLQWSEVDDKVCTHVVVDGNAQPFNDLDLVWVPHIVLIGQEVSEGWHPIFLRGIHSRIQCHRQRVRRNQLSSLGGSRVSCM